MQGGREGGLTRKKQHTRFSILCFITRVVDDDISRSPCEAYVDCTDGDSRLDGFVMKRQPCQSNRSYVFKIMCSLNFCHTKECHPTHYFPFSRPKSWSHRISAYDMKAQPRRLEHREEKEKSHQHQYNKSINRHPPKYPFFANPLEHQSARRRLIHHIHTHRHPYPLRRSLTLIPLAPLQLLRSVFNIINASVAS